MNLLRRSRLYLKALSELGPGQIGLYAWYLLKLRTGYLRWRTPLRRSTKDYRRTQPYSGPQSIVAGRLLPLPSRDKLLAVLGDRSANLLVEADEIVSGRVRLFGREPVELCLSAPEPLLHWTAYAQGSMGGGEIGRKGERERKGTTPSRGEGGQGDKPGDIKFTWEPGRFGWAFTLGRAYLISGDERYPAAFWAFVETFLQANPPNLGPHWASAQEVALRLIAFVFAARVFADSPHSTPERIARLEQAVATHAARIPPTLVYARAQNNNHLLSEAAGLYTAGLALPGNPAAKRWSKMGWRWFNRALQTQIEPDGTYAQHSTNYHRLMLQLALWVYILSKSSPRQISKFDTISLQPSTFNRLAAATRWLMKLVDPTSGRTPNLGPNDGAYILPLAACSFEDYRPVMHAAAAAFLGERPFSPGPWEEMALWLGDKEQERKDKRAESEQTTSPSPLSPIPSEDTPHILNSARKDSWAYFRVAHFKSRPGHADQLNLDLWWRDLNITQDAGTYLYNAPPPWDNSLARTVVHNTVTMEGQDQMTRAGRFLYLDWAQAKIIEAVQGRNGTFSRLVAQHDGYRRLGILHRRSVTVQEDGNWLIEDFLLPAKSSIAHRRSSIAAQLHWLLPDWPFEIIGGKDQGLEIRIKSPYGWISLQFKVRTNSTISPGDRLQVVRAGELLCGSGPVNPLLGWASPTYGLKIPALSVTIGNQESLPICFTSQFTFPRF